jgi:hypothetical protein
MNAMPIGGAHPYTGTPLRAALTTRLFNPNKLACFYYITMSYISLIIHIINI